MFLLILSVISYKALALNGNEDFVLDKPFFSTRSQLRTLSHRPHPHSHPMPRSSLVPYCDNTAKKFQENGAQVLA